MNETFQTVAIDQIRLHNESRPPDPSMLNEFIESMKTLGQLRPCLGRRKNGYVELYVGEYRYWAAKSLGWDKLAVIVSNPEHDPN